MTLGVMVVWFTILMACLAAAARDSVGWAAWVAIILFTLVAMIMFSTVEPYGVVTR